MKVTESGSRLLARGAYSAFARVHLFGADGKEFQGHEYEPVVLDPALWDLDSGVYGDPDIGARFMFQAGPPEFVHGYYVTGNDGSVILMDDLSEPFEVVHMGAHIDIKLRYPITIGPGQTTEQ